MRVLAGGILLAAAIAKLARPRQSREALGTFGFDSPGSRWVAWSSLIGLELVLAVAVGAGSDAASFGAAALLLLMASAMGTALMRGRAGEPCGCFGAGSKVSRIAVLRNLALAAVFGAIPFLPELSLSTEGWLAVGLGVSLAATVALGVAVLALAREVGMLRLRLGPGSALEVSHEGPEVGGRTGLIEQFRGGERVEFAVAIFTSVGCHVCRALEPAVESLRSEPSLEVLSFEEGADSDVWEALAIPGAPYAIAMELDGTVMAKGTYNNLSQLESIVATAERRRAERLRVEALGV